VSRSTGGISLRRSQDQDTVVLETSGEVSTEHGSVARDGQRVIVTLSIATGDDGLAKIQIA